MAESLPKSTARAARTLGGFVLERELQRREGFTIFAARDRQGRALTLTTGTSSSQLLELSEVLRAGRFVCFPGLLESSEEAGIGYFVSEELRGEQLERWLEREGPLTPAAAARLLLALCRDLDNADGDAARLARALTPEWLWLWRDPDGEVTCQISPAGLLEPTAVEAYTPDREVRLLATLLGRLAGLANIAAVPALATLLERALDPRPVRGLTRSELWAELVPIARTSSGRAPAGDAPLPNVRIDQEVQISVFRPKSLILGRWYQLLSFVHLAERRAGDEAELGPLEQVRRLAQAALGKRFGSYRLATEDALAGLPEGGHVTLVPEVEGVEFNPPSRSFAWHEDIHQESFQLRALRGSVGSTLRGNLSAYLGSVLLAEVGMAFKLADAETDEPLATDRARSYRKIFASYSHADERIVSDFARIAETFGDRYLIDVRDLRAGERWSEGLERLIDGADIFQLFWSTRSMYSEFCRREWEYALARGVTIRPVYWESPMPADEGKQLPPAALRGIHFARLGGGVRAESADAAAASTDVPSARTPRRAWGAVMGALTMLVLVGGALWAQRSGDATTTATREDRPTATAEPTHEPVVTGPEVAVLDSQKARGAASAAVDRGALPSSRGGGHPTAMPCPPGDPLCPEPSGRVCFARVAPANSTPENPTSSPSCSNFERGDDSLLRAAQLAQGKSMGCSSVVAYSCSKPNTPVAPVRRGLNISVK